MKLISWVATLKKKQNRLYIVTVKTTSYPNSVYMYTYKINVYAVEGHHYISFFNTTIKELKNMDLTFHNVYKPNHHVVGLKSY